MSEPIAEWSRSEFEDIWRERLEDSKERYDAASARCREVLAEHNASRSASFPKFTPTPDGTFAIAQALKTESAARQEYVKVLHIFTHLVIHGDLPQEP